MGQHSPKGTSALRQSLSSQTMSSQRIFPVSHTQMRQDVGFHTSLSLYICPSCKQLPASSAPSGGGSGRAGRGESQRERQRGSHQLDMIQRNGGVRPHQTGQACKLALENITDLSAYFRVSLMCLALCKMCMLRGERVGILTQQERRAVTLLYSLSRRGGGLETGKDKLEGESEWYEVVTP